MTAHEADRFPSINDADLDALFEARDANNTKYVIKYRLRILRDFVCREKYYLRNSNNQLKFDSIKQKSTLY